jgi:dTDP-glucose 4,6-dehydratase
MKVLISGGLGFLGAHLVEHFLKNTGVEIVVLDKMTYASSGFDRLREIGAYENPRVRVFGCDLGQPIPDGVDREVGDLTYVIHAAAETHVDNSIRDPLPFLVSNVIGTHNLLWWLRGRAKKPSRVFVISTDEVYGPAAFGDDVAGFDEQAPFRPANPYSASKAGEEAVAMAYANTYGLPVTIVNSMNLIGERQHKEKYVPLVIGKLLRDEKLYIHADDKLQSGTRFYLHCRTFANALHFLMASNSPTLPRKLHVCGEREISNLELAQIIAGIVGKELRYELVSWQEDRPGHDLRYAMQDRLIQELGWKRPMNIEQSLEKTVRWYLANPKWLE